MTTSRSPSPRIREASVRLDEAAKIYRTGTPREAWLIVALLFLFMLVNFADKAVIGIAAVPMMQELGLSPSEFGLIGSSFFLLSRFQPLLPALSSIACRRAGRCWSWASSGH
jgi:ACS family D-galactonate transporter-like MFS transporter